MRVRIKKMTRWFGVTQPVGAVIDVKSITAARWLSKSIAVPADDLPVLPVEVESEEEETSDVDVSEELEEDTELSKAELFLVGKKVGLNINIKRTKKSKIVDIINTQIKRSQEGRE